MKEVARNVVFLDATYKGLVFEKSKKQSYSKRNISLMYKSTSLDLCHVTCHTSI